MHLAMSLCQRGREAGTQGRWMESSRAATRSAPHTGNQAQGGSRVRKLVPARAMEEARGVASLGRFWGLAVLGDGALP